MEHQNQTKKSTCGSDAATNPGLSPSPNPKRASIQSTSSSSSNASSGSGSSSNISFGSLFERDSAFSVQSTSTQSNPEQTDNDILAEEYGLGTTEKGATLSDSECEYGSEGETETISISEADADSDADVKDNEDKSKSKKRCCCVSFPLAIGIAIAVAVCCAVGIYCVACSGNDLESGSGNDAVKSSSANANGSGSGTATDDADIDIVESRNAESQYQQGSDSNSDDATQSTDEDDDDDDEDNENDFDDEKEEDANEKEKENTNSNTELAPSGQNNQESNDNDPQGGDENKNNDQAGQPQPLNKINKSEQKVKDKRKGKEQQKKMKNKKSAKSQSPNNSQKQKSKKKGLNKNKKGKNQKNKGGDLNKRQNRKAEDKDEGLKKLKLELADKIAKQKQKISLLDGKIEESKSLIKRTKKKDFKIDNELENVRKKANEFLNQECEDVTDSRNKKLEELDKQTVFVKSSQAVTFADCRDWETATGKKKQKYQDEVEDVRIKITDDYVTEVYQKLLNIYFVHSEFTVYKQDRNLFSTSKNENKGNVMRLFPLKGLGDDKVEKSLLSEFVYRFFTHLFIKGDKKQEASLNPKKFCSAFVTNVQRVAQEKNGKYKLFQGLNQSSSKKLYNASATKKEFESRCVQIMKVAPSVPCTFNRLDFNQLMLDHLYKDENIHEVKAGYTSYNPATKLYLSLQFVRLKFDAMKLARDLIESEKNTLKSWNECILGIDGNTTDLSKVERCNDQLYTKVEQLKSLSKKLFKVTYDGSRMTLKLDTGIASPMEQQPFNEVLVSIAQTYMNKKKAEFEAKKELFSKAKDSAQLNKLEMKDEQNVLICTLEKEKKKLSQLQEKLLLVEKK